jgi:hypothetical protein
MITALTTALCIALSLLVLCLFYPDIFVRIVGYRPPEKVYSDPATYWLCGRDLVDSADVMYWELIGIFPTYHAAEAACTDDKCFLVYGTMFDLVYNDAPAWTFWHYPLATDPDADIDDVLGSMKPGEV